MPELSTAKPPVQGVKFYVYDAPWTECGKDQFQPTSVVVERRRDGILMIASGPMRGGRRASWTRDQRYSLGGFEDTYPAPPYWLLQLWVKVKEDLVGW